MDRENVQAIVEIATEFAIQHHLFEIAVGGGDQAHVGLDQLVAAQTFKFLLLQHAQQFGLQFQRHIAYFVKEQRAFIRQFETTNALGAGTGKRAALVTEQVAFQQARRHCRAVHFHHPAVITAAQVMDGAGNQLFAGAGFTEDQHRTVAWGDHLHLLEDVEHRFATTDDFAKLAVDVVELFGQRQVFIHQTLFQTVDFLISEGVIHGDGDAFGNLFKQLEVGGAEDFFIALGKLQHAEHLVAGHQRQQAQRLDFIVPHLKQLAFVRGEFVLLVEVEHQHLFAFEHPLGERA